MLKSKQGMVKNHKIVALLSAFLCVLLMHAQEIRDISAEQVGNNIEISYLLNGRADIQISYSTDGGATFSAMRSTSGDVGHGVLAGHKKIVWNVLEDLDDLITHDLRFKLEIINDPVLCTIAGDDIHLSEFLYIYHKNQKGDGVSIYSREEYLSLYINFMLKVKAAEDAGMAKTEEFKKEWENYKKSSINNFMRDSLAMDSMLRLTHKRLQRIRSASHIAIECPETADAKTTQEKLALIEQARLRVTTGGESFYQVAREVSTDPNVLETNGKLGYIIPLRYVYPLEDAVYNTPVGQVTPIVRTKYGFHIAFVEEERDNIEVHASHIMLHATNPHAKDSIYILYDKLKRGADFARIAKNYSKDKGSAGKGGDVGWFGRGIMIKPFEDVAFEKHQVGDISEPFETQYGWHIIKYMGSRNYLPLDSVKESLTKKILKDERYKEVEKAYLRKARAQYNIEPSMSDEQALQYIKEHLEDLDSDYRNLVREYYLGILLFDISMREVWDKAAKDEAGLMAYYKAHKKDFNKSKDFEEIRNNVVTAYQDYLEAEWIKQLRKRYPVTIHYDVLYDIPNTAGK